MSAVSSDPCNVRHDWNFVVFLLILVCTLHVLSIDNKNTQNTYFWTTIFNHLGNNLVLAPTGEVPKVHEILAQGQGRRLIIIHRDYNQNKPSNPTLKANYEKYIWPEVTSSNQVLRYRQDWMWDGDTWKSGDPGKVSP